MDVTKLHSDILYNLNKKMHAALYYKEPKNYKHRYRLAMIHGRIELERIRRLKIFLRKDGINV